VSRGLVGVTLPKQIPSRQILCILTICATLGCSEDKSPKHTETAEEFPKKTETSESIIVTDLKATWADRLQYEGVILEDPDYNIWGSSPIWGNDGKVHVFSARIPVATGFYKWWATSEIAHYVADKPGGPFKLVEVLLKPGDSSESEWDCGTQHNPTITKIDDLFVLSYHSAMGTLADRRRDTIRIGMMTATDINGPWTKLGKVLDPPTPEESNVVTGEHYGFTDNPSLVRHPDGRFFLYYRIKFPGLKGGNTYAVAIADKLEGPYVHYPDRVVNNPTYIEDPYVFVHNGLFYMLITDNHNPKGKQGMLLTSKDGLSFDYYQGEGFGVISDYISEEQLPADPAEIPGGCFERPQLLLKDGVPTHLFTPCGQKVDGDVKTRCYLFSINTENK
jgi:hypothetical protein